MSIWERLMMYRYRALGGILGAYCGLHVAVNQVAATMTGRILTLSYNPSMSGNFPFTIFTEPASLAGDLGSIVLIWPLVIVLMIPAIRILATSYGDSKIIDAVQIGFGLGWAIVGFPLSGMP